MTNKSVSTGSTAHPVVPKDSTEIDLAAALAADRELENQILALVDDNAGVYNPSEAVIPASSKHARSPSCQKPVCRLPDSESPQASPGHSQTARGSRQSGFKRSASALDGESPAAAAAVPGKTGKPGKSTLRSKGKRHKESHSLADEYYASEGNRRDQQDDDDEEESSENEDDDLMGSGSDRELLEKLPELERERILNERAEKRDLERERRAIERKLRESGITLYDDADASKKKEKSKSNNKKSRKDVGNARANQRYEKNHHAIDSSRLNDDDSVESDSENVGQQSSNSVAEITFEQMKKMQLCRENIAKWCFATFFEDLAIGSFVRVSIGEDNGASVYRIAEIESVEQHKRSYYLDRVVVNVAFVLRHGKHKRRFIADIFSNRQLTEAEFIRWKAQLRSDGLEIPDQEMANKKIAAIEKAKLHVFSEAEVAEIIRRKKELSVAPRNYASEKAELLRRYDVALDANNAEESREIERQLDDLRAHAAEARSHGDPLKRQNERLLRKPEGALKIRDLKSSSSVAVVQSSTGTTSLSVGNTDLLAQKSFAELFTENVLNVDL